MEDLIIEGIHDKRIFIPAVKFVASTGECSITGESFLENTISFYEPLIKWVKLYCEEVKKPISLSINLSYFDTSSSKSILNLLYVLKTFKENGGQFMVSWYHTDYDDDMAEDIEDFRSDFGMDIKRIPI